jgi:hypothetical protein
MWLCWWYGGGSGLWEVDVNRLEKNKRKGENEYGKWKKRLKE